MLLKFTIFSSELLAWGWNQYWFITSQIFFKLQLNIHRKMKIVWKFWLPVVMVFKFQCPDSSHPFFSFFEPFQNWVPGTHTEIGVSHPRRLPTSLAYFLHETYEEASASKEESSPTSITEQVSGRFRISQTLPQAASNPSSHGCCSSQKAQNTHQSGIYCQPLPNSLGFSTPQLLHTCMHAASNTNSYNYTLSPPEHSRELTHSLAWCQTHRASAPSRAALQPRH